MPDINRTIICTAAQVEECRTIASQFLGGEGMFKTVLSSDGSEPTHYISSGHTPEEIISALTGICEISEGEPLSVIAAMGLSLIADGAE